MYNLNTPIWQLTVGEFLELQERAIKQQTRHHEIDNKPKRLEKTLVYGISGLAELLSCSKGTAQKIKNSGTIDKAVSQCGKKIVIDADLALELIRKDDGKITNRRNS